MKIEVSAKLVVDPARKPAPVQLIAVRIRFVPKGSGHKYKSRRLAEAMAKGGAVQNVKARSSGVDCTVDGTVEGVLAALEFLAVPPMRAAS